MKKKSDISFSARIGKKQITLPDKLLIEIFKEIVVQVGKDFEDIDFELTIEVQQKSVTVTKAIQEPLSDFNKKLVTALEFNPKKK